MFPKGSYGYEFELFAEKYHILQEEMMQSLGPIMSRIVRFIAWILK